MNSLPNHTNNWNRILPPFRPTDAVAARMRELAPDGTCLLLGVTPEICLAFPEVIAVDSNAEMIQRVWPGDTPGKTAMLADWTTMEWPEARFASIVGDCAITLLDSFASITAMQSRAFEWLQPGGRFIHRIFEQPEEPIGIEELVQQLSQPATIGFTAFKLRLQYYQAQQDRGPHSLAQVLDLFNSIAPDRDVLCAATGWLREHVDTIDLYEGTNTIACKPTRAEWMSMVPAQAVNLEFHHVFGYDLSGTCPIMVWEKPQ